MPRKRATTPKSWAEDFVKEVYLSEPYTYEFVERLTKKLQSQYSLGYNRANRPIKPFKCSWCGKKMVRGDIHPECQIIKEQITGRK